MSGDLSDVVLSCGDDLGFKCSTRGGMRWNPRLEPVAFGRF